MKIAMLWGILLCLSIETRAQTETSKFLDKDAAKEKMLFDAVSSTYNKDIASLGGANKKYIADLYKERYELIREKFTSNEVVTDPKPNATSKSNYVRI